MKKTILTLLALVLVLALVGCAPSVPANSTGENAAAHILTKEEAKTLVFSHANANSSDVSAVEIELDEEDGAIFYDVEFDYQDKEYDYRVDALTGKILYSKAEPKDAAPQPTQAQPAETVPAEKPAEEKPAETKPASTTTKKKIGVSAAKAAAFKHAGVKSSDAWDVEVDLDTENGKLVYEVSFNAGSYDYDYDIDAYTGKVLRSEKEKDD